MNYDESGPQRSVGRRICPLDDKDDEMNEGPEDQEEFRLRVVITPGERNVRLLAINQPHRKKDLFSRKALSTCRFKQNVGLLEVRVGVDQNSGCVDKTKCVQSSWEDMDTGSEKSKRKQQIPLETLSQEVFQGKIYDPIGPLNYGICKIEGGTCFVTPIDGLLSLGRSMEHMNAKKVVDKDFEDESSATESDADQEKPVRVKFARPETERQKKRREASAYHREKQVAQDVWLPLEVHNAVEEELQGKAKNLLSSPQVSFLINGQQEAEAHRFGDLVSDTILRKSLERIDLSKCRETELVIRRLRESLPFRLQVKAILVKASVISHTALREIFKDNVLEELLDVVKEIASLIRGNWVLNSREVFNWKTTDNPTRRKVFTYKRMEEWRMVRDFALYFLDNGELLTRNDLQRFFRLKTADLEQVVATFGRFDAGKRTIQLKLEDSTPFLPNDPFILPIIVEQRRRFNERIAEIVREFQ